MGWTSDETSTVQARLISDILLHNVFGVIFVMLTAIVQRVVQTFAQVKVQKTNINVSNLLLFVVPLQSEKGFRFFI